MFFFNDTATTEIYTLSLHDALPIYHGNYQRAGRILSRSGGKPEKSGASRSEEHTSELQSPNNLVCRLLLDKTIRANSLADTNSSTRTPTDVSNNLQRV